MDTVRNWEIRRYHAGDAGRWDEFVRASRNGTFLLERGYMDYHSDRFRDSSWLAYRNGRLRALLPGNITDDGVLHSHQGLTYGGWILPFGHANGADVLSLFEAAAEAWKAEGYKALDYKPIPAIYHRNAASEDIYALWRMGAEQTGCGMSSAIDLTSGAGLDTMQRRHLRSAAKYDWHIAEEEDCTEFMEMLAECLRERHDVAPVHNAGEMELLRNRFPGNIRIFTVRLDGEKRPDAGVCVYDTGIVAHAQYIAATPRGRELNLLTPLFSRLTEDTFAMRRWFDFGISTEDNGHYLNAGLLRQKSSYGSGAVIYPRYLLKI